MHLKHLSWKIVLEWLATIEIISKEHGHSCVTGVVRVTMGHIAHSYGQTIIYIYIYIYIYSIDLMLAADGYMYIGNTK